MKRFFNSPLPHKWAIRIVMYFVKEIDTLNHAMKITNAAEIVDNGKKQ